MILNEPFYYWTEYCSKYINITDEWRKVHNGEGNITPHSDRQNTQMNGINWFRFVNPAGSKLPDTSPPKKAFKGEQICGTYSVAWIDGSHPNTTDTIIDRRICFSWFRKACMGPLPVHIGKCNENNGNYFYIYQLKRPTIDSSTSAYCAL